MPLNVLLEVGVFYVWEIDFMGLFVSSCKNQYILLAVDSVSKWVEVKALPTNDAKVVLNFLYKQIFTRFGTLRVIISNEGSHFCNRKFTAMMKRYNVNHRIATAYHPQTNVKLRGFPVWLKYVPGISFRIDNEPFLHISRCYRLKDGRWNEEDAAVLVPGDIISIKLGDIVPADARLLEDNPLKTDQVGFITAPNVLKYNTLQSSLTGESLPVTKGPGDGVYPGSTCKQGEIDVVVIATGVHTFFEKAGYLVDSTNQVGRFQNASYYNWYL
ncbi:hypothetical protein AgCh_034004 [Apium graveolens]